MQIPAELPSFERPTLLVVSDSQHALFFEIHNRILEPAGKIEVDYPAKENMQRTSGKAPGGTHFAEQAEKLEDEKEHRFAHLLSHELQHRLQQKTFEELLLTAPQERLTEFIEALHHDIKSRLKKTLPKQLTKESPIEILKRIYETN